MNKYEEIKHWENLYYKENALVGLLQLNIEFLEKEVHYWKGKVAFMQKYGINEKGM